MTYKVKPSCVKGFELWVNYAALDFKDLNNLKSFEYIDFDSICILSKLQTQNKTTEALYVKRDVSVHKLQ